MEPHLSRTAGGIARTNSSPPTAKEILRHRPFAGIYEEVKAGLVYRERGQLAGQKQSRRPVIVIGAGNLNLPISSFNVVSRSSPAAVSVGLGAVTSSASQNPVGLQLYGDELWCKFGAPFVGARNRFYGIQISNKLATITVSDPSIKWASGRLSVMSMYNDWDSATLSYATRQMDSTGTNELDPPEITGDFSVNARDIAIFNVGDAAAPSYYPTLGAGYTETDEIISNTGQITDAGQRHFRYAAVDTGLGYSINPGSSVTVVKFDTPDPTFIMTRCPFYSHGQFQIDGMGVGGQIGVTLSDGTFQYRTIVSSERDGGDSRYAFTVSPAFDEDPTGLFAGAIWLPITGFVIAPKAATENADLEGAVMQLAAPDSVSAFTLCDVSFFETEVP